MALADALTAEVVACVVVIVNQLQFADVRCRAVGVNQNHVHAVGQWRFKVTKAWTWYIRTFNIRIGCTARVLQIGTLGLDIGTGSSLGKVAGRCAYGLGTGEAIDTLGYLFCRERVVFVDAFPSSSPDYWQPR